MTTATQSEKKIPMREPNGPLWAYPVFVLGVVVFILSAIYGPLPFTGPTGALRRIALLRNQLEATQPAELADWLEEAEKSAALTQQTKIQVSAKLLLAEGWLKRSTVLPQEEAAQRIQLVQQDLNAIGVPEAQLDEDRKNYLLALAKFLTGDDLTSAATSLSLISDDSELAADSLELLAKCHLRRQPPDVTGALAANERLRGLGRLSDAQRGQAQLAAGELYLALQKPEDARRVLEKVGARAPGEVRAKAGVLLAQSYQEQGLWSQAAEAWQALIDSKATDDQQVISVAWFSLGLCYQKNEQPTHAMEAFEKVLEFPFPKGEAARQANLLLAQSQTTEPDPTRSLGHFQAAFDGIDSQNLWRAKWIDLNRARELVEQSLDVWMRANQHAAARALAEMNMRIAEPSRGTILLAQVLENQARFLRDPLGYERAGGKETALAESRNLFLQAAAANSKAAETLTDPAQQSAHLWLAAKQNHEARDYVRVVELLSKFLAASPNSDKSGEAWYLMGESLAALKRDADSLLAYKECIKFLTPFSYRARFRIGADALRKGNLDVAADTLEHNMQVLRLDPDPIAQEWTLYTLGSLYWQRQDWKLVVRRLEEAVERYPNYIENLKARLRLADAYRYLASQENQNAISGERITTETSSHFQAEYRRWLERAVSTYNDVRLALELPGASSLLDQSELDKIGLMLADTWFRLGRYNDALQLYEEQVAKLEGRKEQLTALGGMVQCYSSMGKFDKIPPITERIRQALPGLDEKTRKEWEFWVITASRSTKN